MTSATAPRTIDTVTIPYIVRRAVILGFIVAIIVGLFAVVTRLFDGPVEKILEAILLVIGLSATVMLPGLWTRARNIDGIAAAAAIGLGGTVVFLLIDVAVLQPLGAYTFRWRALGGGSNWWYHPVWWMVGTYLSWMGGFIFANQTVKNGQPSVIGLVMLTLVGMLIFGVIGIVLHVPGAAWTLPTFGVAVLPALALAAIVSGLGTRRP
ncbi:MAG: hypothetical protein ABI679_04790 [Gemmatimonadota bacterium]